MDRRCFPLVAILFLTLGAIAAVAPAWAGNPVYGVPEVGQLLKVCDYIGPNYPPGTVVPEDCFPQLHSLRLFPGTSMSGSVEDLFVPGAGLILWAVPYRNAECSLALSFIFEVPSPALANELVVGYWTANGDAKVRVEVLDPQGGKSYPLECDLAGWKVTGELACDLPLEALSLRLKSQPLLEILMAIEVRCDKSLKGVGADAVAVSKVRLGPPPRPPK